MNRIYGLTIEGTDTTDDGTGIKIDKLLAVLSQLPVKPVLRLCLEFGVKPYAYLDVARELRGNGYPLMLQPVDSEDTHRYSLTGYANRFYTTLSALGDFADYIECGNEINGDWCGPMVMEKTDQALVHVSKYFKKIITLYITEGWESWLPRMSSFNTEPDMVLFSVYTNSESIAKSFMPQDWPMIPYQTGISEYGSEDSNGNMTTFQEKRTLIQNFETRTAKNNSDIIGGFYWDFYGDCVKGNDPQILDVFKTVWGK